MAAFASSCQCLVEGLKKNTSVHLAATWQNVRRDFRAAVRLNLTIHIVFIFIYLDFFFLFYFLYCTLGITK